MAAGSDGRAGRGHFLAVSALIFIAAVWGLSFPTMKSALLHVSPYELLAMRNLLGFLALLVIWYPGLSRERRSDTPLFDRYTLGAGILLGLALVCGLALQVIGLQSTTSIKAGFISGLYVIFTPFVAIPIVRRVPSGALIVAAFGATFGLFLLTVGDLRSLRSMQIGDLMNLGAALAFALHVALTGRYAPRCDFRRLCIVEACTKAAAFSFGFIGLDFKKLLIPSVITAVVVTGLGATALGLAVQTWAQRRVSPSATAVILASEPAFAGLFGFLILGEALSPKGIAGALIMLAAIVLAAAGAGKKVVAAPT